MNQSFEILKTGDPDVRKLLGEKISSEICEFNSANIYELKNERYLVVPKQLSKYVILYHSKDELEKHIKEECFPIEDYETDSLVEPEKENIKEIKDSIGIYIQYLEKKLDILNNFSSQISNISKIESLQRAIDGYDKDKLTKYDILCIGLYTNEIFRIDTNSSWNIELVFTLNTYWYPTIINQKDKYDVASKVYSSFFEGEYLDLVFFFKLEKAKYLGYEPFSKEHTRYMQSNIPK
ncbi:hypothetical protein [Aquimarina mytili]|uniref:Uncharacterized protein n=1 Tax=Aquimarina mytili TaxID=874423 RepID=A0A937A4H4_9FLAO|nr:hypothetical protein [Aquimarina mytili]MBL0684184.1 hypothetical protein [Aquimarina mytili]